MIDFDIKKNFEKVDILVRNEGVHCLAMTARAFVILWDHLEQFFNSESPANLTADQMQRFKLEFQIVTLAFLTNMAERLKNHKTIFKVDGQPVFCSCRAN